MKLWIVKGEYIDPETEKHEDDYFLYASKKAAKFWCVHRYQLEGQRSIEIPAKKAKKLGDIPYWTPVKLKVVE